MKKSRDRKLHWLQEQKENDDDEQNKDARSSPKTLETELPSSHELKYKVYSLKFPLLFYTVELATALLFHRAN